MPFPTRVISSREDIAEVFNNNPDGNVLQKATVSNLVGLLNQLNKVSLYANEVFTEILQSTSETGARIKRTRQRIADIEAQVPKVERMLIGSAPNYFYDNPYPGKEYLRNDPLDGLLFTREDAAQHVNNRRNHGRPPADLSALDRFSKNGPCIKSFSDADFFINEWLENEKRKREEEREQRRQMKANRNKEKDIRKEKKTIARLHKKRYNTHDGNEITDTEPKEREVTQYKLTEDTNRDFSALLNNKGKKKRSKKEPESEAAAASSLAPASKHQPTVSYGIPEQPMKAQHVSVNSNPPPNPLQLTQSVSNESTDPMAARKGPPPNPVMGGPPPNPLALQAQPSQTEQTNKKLRHLSAEIPMDDISYDIPDNAPSPPQIYASSYQKRKDHLDEQQPLDLSKAANIIATSPKQVAPVPPKLGFLADINNFKQRGGLKKTDVNVNRHKPTDQRTNLLAQLKNNKVQLTSVNLRKVPKKEEKKNLIFQAMADRRKHMEDSSDESDSDWGSESD